jgi:RsiW-degrading membrane proteinase PrsW (M82 family)
VIISISSGHTELSRFDLRRGALVVGRDAQNAIRTNELVLHPQVRIRLAGDTAVVETLPTSEICQLNGAALNRPMILASGDMLKIGSDTLQLKLSPTTKLQLRAQDLIPFNELWQSLKRPPVWLLLLGLLPLGYAFLVAVNYKTADEAALDTFYFFGLFFSLIWGVIIYHIALPSSQGRGKERVQWGIGCTVFTMVMLLTIYRWLISDPIINYLDVQLPDSQNFWQSLEGFLLGVGPLEELIKAIPVLGIVYLLKKGTDPSTAAFYGAMSGLGFAVKEGILYSSIYLQNLAQTGPQAIGPYLTEQLLRQISLPLGHASWAAIFGFFIGLSALYPTRRWQLLIAGWIIAAVAHGLYDGLASYIPLLSLVILIAAVLICFQYLTEGGRLLEGPPPEGQEYSAVTDT